MAVADTFKQSTRTFRTTIGVFVAVVGITGILPHRERALLQLEAATGLVARTLQEATFQAVPVTAGGGGAVGVASVPSLRVAGVAAPLPVVPGVLVPRGGAASAPVPAAVLPLGGAAPASGVGTGEVLGADAGPTQLASLGGLPGFGGGGSGGGGSISNPTATSTGGTTTSTSTGGDTSSTSTGGTTTSTGGTTTSTSTSTGGDTSTSSTSTGGDVTSTGGTTSTSTGGVVPVSPVPEPATWAMMILGFGFVGSALRTARRPALA